MAFHRMQKEAMALKIHDTVADLAAWETPGGTLSAEAGLSLTRHRAVVEHHGGLLGYGDECVEVRDHRGRLRILGSQLVLRAMDRETLIVTGHISGVEYA